MKTGMKWLLLLLSPAAMACSSEQMERATQLMLEANPILQAQVAVTRLQSEQSDWKASLRLAVSTAQAKDSASGVAVAVEIPLFDKSNEIKLRQQQQALSNKRNELLEQFVGELSNYCELSDEQHRLLQQKQFHKDRLDYQQQRVGQGLDEAASLWTLAEQYQQSVQDWQSNTTTLELKRYSLARSWGGEQWQALQSVLAGTAN